MRSAELPQWLYSLGDEDIRLMKEFVLSSGSLKAMAGLYQVTYPTIRLRLDRLIDKVKQADANEETRFEGLLKDLTLAEEIKPSAARRLLRAYEKEKQER